MLTRLVPIRQLTPSECELLDYIGPLMLAGREHKFLIGPWRKTKVVLVTQMFDESGQAEIMMTCSVEQLLERGVDPGMRS
jgi:hypothetical protein